LARNNPYGGVYYSNNDHHQFMVNLSMILTEQEIDWFDDFYDEDF